MCFGCDIVFCDMSSSSVPILLKCSCLFSKAKQLMSLLSLSMVFGLLALVISFLR